MKYIPGIALCFVVALPAWFLGGIFTLAGPPVIAILTGILISILIPNLPTLDYKGNISFTAGTGFTSKKILQFSVVLIGFSLNLYNALELGFSSIIIMLIGFLIVFLAAYFLTRILKLQGNTGILIGVGTSICGGSAIAAAAPVINAKDEDIAKAISTIFLFNIIAVLVFPLLGSMAGLSDRSFGVWAGLAINDTSSVVAAGTVWSNRAGENTALTVSTIIKLTRTLMIIPVTLALAIYTARKQKNKEGSSFKLKKIFPWFVLFFIAAAVLNTFISLPQGFSSSLVQLGKFGITMAMAAIGLNTNIKKLISSGIKPLFLGGILWFLLALVSLLFITRIFI